MMLAYKSIEIWYHLPKTMLESFMTNDKCYWLVLQALLQNQDTCLNANLIIQHLLLWKKFMFIKEYVHCTRPLVKARVSHYHIREMCETTLTCVECLWESKEERKMRHGESKSWQIVICWTSQSEVIDRAMAVLCFTTLIQIYTSNPHAVHQ